MGQKLLPLKVILLDIIINLSEDKFMTMEPNLAHSNIKVKISFIVRSRFNSMSHHMLCCLGENNKYLTH